LDPGFYGADAAEHGAIAVAGPDQSGGISWSKTPWTVGSIGGGPKISSKYDTGTGGVWNQVFTAPTPPSTPPTPRPGRIKGLGAFWIKTPRKVGPDAAGARTKVP
jgi:hypothetical protein